MQSVNLTRRRFCATLSSTALLSHATFAVDTNVDHTPQVTPISQGNSNLCWLATSTMLLSWKRKKALSMADVATELGSPFATLHAEGLNNPSRGGLPFPLVKELASRLWFTAEGLQSFTTTWWISRIGAGPLFVGGYEKNDSMGHVLLVTGIQGNKSDIASLQVSLINPNSGKAEKRGFRAFIEFYEALAGSATQGRVPQILY